MPPTTTTLPPSTTTTLATTTTAAATTTTQAAASTSAAPTTTDPVTTTSSGSASTTTQDSSTTSSSQSSTSVPDSSTTTQNVTTTSVSSATTSLSGATTVPASTTTTKASTSTTKGSSGGGGGKTPNTAAPLITTTTVYKVTVSTAASASALSTQFVSTTIEADMTASTVVSSDNSYAPTTLAPVFLIVEVISPRSGASASNVQEIRLRVRHSNDGLIPDQSLNVLIGAKNVSLARVGDFFVGEYSPQSNVSDLNISVSDGLGYSGKAGVKLVASQTLIDDGIARAAGSFGLVAAGIFVLFVLPLMIVRRFRSSKEDKTIEKGQYNEVKKMIDSLNKESEDDSISKWVFDKLSHGEDPEVLKKGLEEMGYDPKIVDKVLDSQ
jgi:hypothetical protein